MTWTNCIGHILTCLHWSWTFCELLVIDSWPTFPMTSWISGTISFLERIAWENKRSRIGYLLASSCLVTSPLLKKKNSANSQDNLLWYFGTFFPVKSFCLTEMFSLRLHNKIIVQYDGWKRFTKEGYASPYLRRRLLQARSGTDTLYRLLHGASPKLFFN